MFMCNSKLVPVLGCIAVLCCTAVSAGQAAPDSKAVLADGPVDGLRKIRFTWLNWRKPSVRDYRKDLVLAETGCSVDRKLGERASPLVVHEQLGPNEFVSRFSAPRTFRRVQEGESLCWAAGLEMVNAARGVRVIDPKTGRDADQAELARHFRGGAADQTADLVVVIRGLCPDLEASLGENLFTLGASFATQSSDRLVFDLCAGSPAIVGLDKGSYRHVVVVIGARYSWLKDGERTRGFQAFLHGAQNLVNESARPIASVVSGEADANNALAIRELFYIDPNDGMEYSMRGKDFASCCLFIMTPQLAREILTEKSNVSVVDVGQAALKKVLESGGERESRRTSSQTKKAKDPSSGLTDLVKTLRSAAGDASKP
ncbi:MAG: hypothetical protein K8S98_08430 [Planctomycetes bacterium]|nr:hypothetical protein [Planctomycetota bacterium]